jgi:hypothetical protein
MKTPPAIAPVRSAAAIHLWTRSQPQVFYQDQVISRAHDIPALIKCEVQIGVGIASQHSR